MTRYKDDVWLLIDTQGGDASKCWPWTGPVGSRDRDRGVYRYEGRTDWAYRVVYELVHGPIPIGHKVRHACDNPLCCNPAHLKTGTQSDNERDKTLTDRVGLPVRVVREIRRLLLTTNWTQQAIADFARARFLIDVSRESVRNIKLGLRRTENEMTRDEIEELGIEEVKRRMT